jgi:hypothetical protein
VVVPEPLAVIDVGETDAVYVMSRAQGRVLGACVVDPRLGETTPPSERFGQALQYLAAYQGWGSTAHPGTPECGDAEQRAISL